jgi:hypothetical protein
MGRSRIIGLAVVAMFIMSAVATASASAALPEWGFAAAATTTFTSKAGAGTLESTSGTKVKCTSNTATGTLEKPKAVKKVTVTYKGCKEGSNECKTTGSAKEEIVTGPIEGTLIYAGAGSTKASELLKHESGGGTFVEFKCGAGLTVKVTGEIIGEATPINKSELTGKLTFEQAGGSQALQQENGVGAKKHLSAFGLVESGLESIETVTFAENVELKA